MPNWCNCQITISGNLEQINEFHKKNIDSEGDIDFNVSVPCSSDNEDWFNWRILNWGTKWSAYDTLTKKIWDDEDKTKLKEIVYLINTAWTPPIQWLKNTSEKYPEIEFELKYEEPNMNFSGIYTVKDGEIIVDENGTHGEYFGEIDDSENPIDD